MSERKTRRVNGHGLGIAARHSGEWVKDFRVYSEGGDVQVWVDAGRPGEIMQWLTPKQALQFALAFARSAVVAWWYEAVRRSL